MRNLSVLFIFFLIFNQAYSVVSISAEKDQESIAKAKEINNVAKIYIKLEKGYLQCTASLVAPNIMITAAHCVQDTEHANPGNPFPIKAFASFHADANDAFEAHFNKIPNSFIPIDAAIIHPDRDLNMKDGSADDVAFIRLTENQDRPVFELYKEDLKPHIEVLLNPKSVKNYDVNSFLMNCYGYGFGVNVPGDSIRRYFLTPVQMVEQKEDWFHDFYLQSKFFGPFPNDKTFESAKSYDLEERTNFNERLIKINGSSLDEFLSSGDSGSALLFNNHIIGIYSYGSNYDVKDFESVRSFYGVVNGSFAPLFDMNGKPIEKIYNMIPQLSTLPQLGIKTGIEAFGLLGLIE
jgi:hypothetical protein